MHEFILQFFTHFMENYRCCLCGKVFRFSGDHHYLDTHLRHGHKLSERQIVDGPKPKDLKAFTESGASYNMTSEQHVEVKQEMGMDNMLVKIEPPEDSNLPVSEVKAETVDDGYKDVKPPVLSPNSPTPPVPEPTFMPDMSDMMMEPPPSKRAHMMMEPLHSHRDEVMMEPPVPEKQDPVMEKEIKKEVDTDPMEVKVKKEVDMDKLVKIEPPEKFQPPVLEVKAEIVDDGYEDVKPPVLLPNPPTPPTEPVPPVHPARPSPPTPAVRSNPAAHSTSTGRPTPPPGTIVQARITPPERPTKPPGTAPTAHPTAPTRTTPPPGTAPSKSTPETITFDGIFSQSTSTKGSTDPRDKPACPQKTSLLPKSLRPQRKSIESLNMDAMEVEYELPPLLELPSEIVMDGCGDEEPPVLLPNSPIESFENIAQSDDMVIRRVVPIAIPEPSDKIKNPGKCSYCNNTVERTDLIRVPKSENRRKIWFEKLGEKFERKVKAFENSFICRAHFAKSAFSKTGRLVKNALPYRIGERVSYEVVEDHLLPSDEDSDSDEDYQPETKPAAIQMMEVVVKDEAEEKPEPETKPTTSATPESSENFEKPVECSYCNHIFERFDVIPIPKSEIRRKIWFEKLGENFERKVKAFANSFICREHFAKSAFSKTGRLVKNALPYRIGENICEDCVDSDPDYEP